jgi:formate dehydrogenase iron-sulfur subunit
MAVRKKKMLLDMSKCIGCKACQVACQQWHQLPAEDTSFEGSYQNPPDKSVANLTVTKFTEMEDPYTGEVKFLYFVDRCRHCRRPPCKTACPLGAIKQTQKGFVYISNKCNPALCNKAAGGPPDPSDTSIRWCQNACPFGTTPPFPDARPRGVPRRRLNNGAQLAGKKNKKMNKCDFCYDRWKPTFRGVTNPLKSGPYNGVFARSDRPACELVCPTGAITTGFQAQITAEAAARVDYLKANGYPDANVYPAGWQCQVNWVLLYKTAWYDLVAM